MVMVAAVVVEALMGRPREMKVVETNDMKALLQPLLSRLLLVEEGLVGLLLPPTAAFTTVVPQVDWSAKEIRPNVTKLITKSKVMR